MAVLEAGIDDATAVQVLPERYGKRLRTNKANERHNEEIRRREREIRIFPNRETDDRLIGALFMEMHEKWSSGKRYLDMTEYHEWKKQQQQAKKVCKVTPLR